MSETKTLLSIAELVHDSTDAEIAKTTAAEALEASTPEPRDSVPPMDRRPSQ